MKLFQDIGGELRLSSEVKRIEIDPKTRKATGVTLSDGTLIEADAIVANSEVGRTYLDLVPAAVRKRNTDHRMKSLRYSMSLFVMYFGTDRKYENIAHHEILMGPRYRELL